MPQSTVGGGDLRPAWGQGDRGVSRGGPAASVSPLLSLCLGGVSRGSCEAGVWPPAVRHHPPAALSSWAPPPHAPAPSPQSTVRGPQAVRELPPGSAPCASLRVQGVIGPSHLGPDRRTEWPLVPSSPAGPSTTPGGLPGPSRCCSTLLEPEEPAALGTQAAWRRGPRRDLLLFRMRGHLELTLPLDPPERRPQSWP